VFGAVSRIKAIKQQVNVVNASYVKSEVYMTLQSWGIGHRVVW